MRKNFLECLERQWRAGARSEGYSEERGSSGRGCGGGAGGRGPPAPTASPGVVVAARSFNIEPARLRSPFTVNATAAGRTFGANLACVCGWCFLPKHPRGRPSAGFGVLVFVIVYVRAYLCSVIARGRFRSAWVADDFWMVVVSASYEFAALPSGACS